MCISADSTLDYRPRVELRLEAMANNVILQRSPLNVTSDAQCSTGLGRKGISLLVLESLLSGRDRDGSTNTVAAQSGACLLDVIALLRAPHTARLLGNLSSQQHNTPHDTNH